MKQPKILILDEATSAIDVRGEKVVQAALDKVSKNRTTIMIAHRLSTVKKADNIIVLAKGQVAQWGTHEQLMAKVGGPYWVLTNAQKLSMGDKEDENPDTLSEITEEETRTMDIMTHDNKKEEPEASKAAAVEEPKVKAKGMFRSFGVMFAEQKHFWPWYLILMFGAVIAGGKLLIPKVLQIWKITDVFLKRARRCKHTCLRLFSPVSHFPLHTLYRLPTFGVSCL